MADIHSFDISASVDMMEVKNALEIAKKEVFGNTGIFLSFLPDCLGRPLADGFKLEFADNHTRRHCGINDNR